MYVYYNKRLVGSANGIDSYNKIVREPYVKVDYSGTATPANTKYSLGFPDVFEIQFGRDDSTTFSSHLALFNVVEAERRSDELANDLRVENWLGLALCSDLN